MRIYLLSDLHNEFDRFIPENLRADIVILAGDIDLRERGVVWAKEVFNCQVLYVPGNHEFYGGHLQRTLEKMRAFSSEQVHILDRDEVIIEGVRFLGATMWTDFEATGSHSTSGMSAQSVLRDFQQIRTRDYKRIRTQDLVVEAVQTRDWLQSKLCEPFDGRSVVITHHAPSLKSLDGNPYPRGPLDAAFANAWDDLIGPPISLWVHGHTHNAVDYKVSGTRVVSNPRGYPDEQTGFNPSLILEV